MKRYLSSISTLLGFVFFCVWASPALAQTPTPEPTPTLVPQLPRRSNRYREHIYLSRQIEQSAEFSLFAYYQAADNAGTLAVLAADLEQISQTLAHIQPLTDDPVVVTDTLPSGNQFAVRREFSYGEITAGLALIVLFLLQLVRFIWDISRPPNY